MTEQLFEIGEKRKWLLNFTKETTLIAKAIELLNYMAK
jgi:hypothetical protein